MNPLEKASWLELTVSLVAVAAAAALFPWLGNAASGAFGLLGLLACSAFFFMPGRNKILFDERDRQIEQQATRTGINAAWMLTFLVLIAIVLWTSFRNGGVVPTWWLTWLVWTQFALCYAVKGLVGVRAYRRGVGHAA